METTQHAGSLGETARRIVRARDTLARRRMRTGARWLGLTVLALALGVAATVLLLRPPAAHVKAIALALALAGAGALALGEVALRVTSAARLGSVRVRLAIPPLLTALVIACTVLALANAMFISPQDSTLLLVFLGFAALVALTLAGTLAGEIGRSIARVETGARRIAQGDYAFRVAERDGATAGELEQLARWFNTMAANVEDAFARRDRAEADRRRVLAALSHDLRTPLASVRAMIEAIDDGVAADDATVRRYHRAIRAEVGRLSRLMDELFELSRLESGALVLQRERLGIEDLISDALEAFHEQAAQAGVRLEGSVDDGLHPVALDPRQIARALGNLVQNALRYAPAGGAVVIHAFTQATSDARGGRELVVRVLDSGSGIDDADLAHIFEQAYRGDPSRARAAEWAEQHGCGSGAGLGLAIARGIVELHGGRIWAESPLPAEPRAQLAPLLPDDAPPYAGTAVAFTLPLSAAASA